MFTAENVYLVFSTLLFLFLFLIWSSKDMLNVVIRIAFFSGVVMGTILFCQKVLTL